jgi:hypothetical protein
MRYLGLLGVCAALVGACNQLPPTSAFSINAVPVFDASSIVSSKNGLLAVDISKIPGAVCVPDSQDKCTSDGFLPAPSRSAGSTITVTAATDTTPKYHSLIDNRYNVTAAVPFVNATVSDNIYNEVTATILATATFSDNSPNSGYPSIDQIRTALQQVGRPATQGYVYWLSAANVISVAVKQFTKVESAANVTVTGVGINGSTYNSATQDGQSVWIGVFAHRIDLTPVPSPPSAIAVQSPSELGGRQLRNLPPIVKNANIRDIPVIY